MYYLAICRVHPFLLNSAVHQIEIGAFLKNFLLLTPKLDNGHTKEIAID